jgi:predicted HNH restriction endonuclease
MGKKLPHTPQSQIKGALRSLFLRSREHSAVLKRSGNSCECCGKKKSVAKGREVKLEVHHLETLAWPQLIEHIRRHLLCDPSKMMALCQSCHKQVHATGEL